MAPYHKRPRISDPEEGVINNEDEETLAEEVGEVDGSVDSEATIPPAIIKFEAWLQSADGGNLDEITCKKHRVQIFKILRVIDSNQDLACLFNERIINEKFIEGFAKKEYYPKTTKSYLMSLRHFYSFCLSEAIGIEISKEKLLSLKEKLARWSTSFRKGCDKRHWEKMEEDLHSLISPEEIAEFERSEASRAAICLLGQLSGAHSIQITQTQYTLIRDFLMVEISVDNANRAGVIANMLLEEFNRASKHDDENVILVKASKTVATHGPARIVMSSKLHSWMNIFVREVRSRVPSVSSEKVFVSWNGEDLKSSQVNKAIKSVWKKAGMTGSPSSTLFRKSAVSKVHNTSHGEEAQGNLANLMAHNIDTARKFYRLQEKSKSSVKASQQLRNVMRGQVQETFDQQKKDSQSSPSLPASEDCASNLNSKVYWSADMEALIKSVFKDEIEKEAVSIEDVRSKISNHPQLENEDPKRVLDKIRSQWRFRKPPSMSTERPASPPSEVETLEQRIVRGLSDVGESSSDIIPPTLGSSVRNVFSDGDLEKIRVKFADMIKKSFPIVKKTIKEALEKDAWGKQLIKKVSVDTIVNRIKYERRMHRK